MPIHVLAPDVAAKIAAGEVVERPANVAKELIENSLDAGATEVRIDLREGGQRLLRVGDDGHGISPAEVQLAVQRHATSKVLRADDLNHITTLGFRGEALYSIAAVSQMTLISRQTSAEVAVQLRLDGGEVVEEGKAGAPVGTSVSVEHLFFNVPARRKFLRKAVTESGRISAIVQRYALAYPGCRFILTNDGRETFRTNGSGDAYDVLVQIRGLEQAKQMKPFGDYTLPGRNAILETASMQDEVVFMPAEDALSTEKIVQPLRVSGYTSLPSLTRANRSGIELFVNGRYVEDRSLTHAVVQAYHTLLPVGRYPMAVVFVDVDPSQVDVNMHPQKTQVRFVDERAAFSAVQRAVREAMLEHAPIPDMNARLEGLPVLDSQAELDAWRARREQIINAGQQAHFNLPTPQPFAPPPLGPRSDDLTDGWSPASEEPSRSVEPAMPDASPEVGPESQPAREATKIVAGKLPPLRVVGQVGALYIIAEGPQGVFLIDQHAAHERILYEQFMNQRRDNKPDGVMSQHVLEPVTLHVGHETTGLVALYLEQLNSIGFQIEPFGGDSFLVQAVPVVLSGQDPQRVIEEIVSSLGERRDLVAEETEARLVKMVCKRAAIKAGQLLSDIEMKELVRQLEACDSPRTCPHGRPTMIQLSAGELEKAFGRV